MLTPYSNSKFVEKIITDCNGREYNAVFFVTLVNGEVRGRIVSVQPLSQTILALSGAVSEGTICLPAWTDNKSVETPYISSVAPVASPYFDAELLLSTQPTRAPSNF